MKSNMISATKVSSAIIFLCLATAAWAIDEEECLACVEGGCGYCVVDGVAQCVCDEYLYQYGPLCNGGTTRYKTNASLFCSTKNLGLVVGLGVTIPLICCCGAILACVLLCCNYRRRAHELPNRTYQLSGRIAPMPPMDVEEGSPYDDAHYGIPVAHAEPVASPAKDAGHIISRGMTDQADAEDTIRTRPVFTIE
ncbi:hypothetical protein ACHAWF_016398 [Thalassiosira exigua]